MINKVASEYKAPIVPPVTTTMKKKTQMKKKQQMKKTLRGKPKMKEKTQK